MEENFVDTLKSRANILEVASWYCNPIKKGSRYFAKCPIHSVDKTPSFCIYEQSNSYFCFSCKASGDSISLVMEMERLSFPEAVEFLAGKYGLEVPKYKSNPGSSKALREHKATLYELMRTSARYYNAMLMSEKGKKGLEYFTNRGLDLDTIKAFGLGYAVDYDGLINHLKSRGFKYDDMVETDVAVKREGKNSYFDPQGGRVIVPIIDSFGNVIAFGGRILEKKAVNGGKYRNSAETILFHKSNVIFGHHIVKKLKNPEYLIVVEGYMDVIALYQAGIHNVVATMGTALTPDQAKQIARYTKKVYLCYDGDAPGQEHIYKGVDILYLAGLDVYATYLPEDLDPDEYIRKYGKDSYLDRVRNSQDIFTYKINTLSKKYNLKDNIECGKFILEALKSLKIIRNVAQTAPYFELISQLTGIDRKVLYDQFNKLEVDKELISRFIEEKNVDKPDGYTKALRFIMFALFNGIKGFKPKDEFFSCKKTEALDKLYQLYREKNSDMTIQELEECIEDYPEAKYVIKEGNSIEEAISEKYYSDCRKKVLLEDVDNKIATVKKDYLSQTDEEAKILLNAQLMNLLAYKRQI